MLRMLERQLRALGVLAQQDFVEEMIEHLLDFAPHHAKSLGTKALRQIVEMGLERALRYGLTQRGPVRFYIELMFHFGSDFDTDPQYPWAAKILKRPWAKTETQLRRANELFFFTNQRLDAVAGPGHKHAFAALERALASGLYFAPDPAGDLMAQILDHLAYLSPEKCADVGRDGLTSLVRHGISEARARGAQTPADRSLVVVLMCGIGHGCLRDPQFPWIGLTFERQASHSDPDAFQRLRDRTLIYLKASLDNMTRRHGPR